MPELRIGSFCTGYGGLDMAVQEVFGGTPVWVADNDPGAARILDHRFPGVPNLGDLTAVDWHNVAAVDIVCGGYPCQPFSTAGHRKGIADDRHIWPHIARALGVLRPRLAVFENVAGHLSLGFDVVLADLARLGFDAEWCCFPASDVGAAHQRRRLFLLAWPADTGRPGLARGWAAWTTAYGRHLAAADPVDVGGDRSWSRGAGRDESAARRLAAADPGGSGRPAGEPDLRPGQPDVAWGAYEPAIRRWEAVLGRPAPRPVDARGRLSPHFVEWLMGLPAGHVTAVPGLSRTAQLKALGNGVVPQQAIAALWTLLARATPEPAWGRAA